eukprot:COSAG06_NODE_10472_length_1676_cov_7.212394_3_plen_121_part_00
MCKTPRPFIQPTNLETQARSARPDKPHSDLCEFSILCYCPSLIGQIFDRRKGQIVSTQLRSHSERGSSVPLSFPLVGFVYPSAPLSRSRSGRAAPLPPPPRGSSFGELQAGSKGFGGRGD